MILHSEIVYKEAFDIERGTHRMNSLLIPLEGTFDYTVGGITQRVSPYQPILFQQGVSFRKVVIRPVTCMILRFSEAPEHQGCRLDYEERDLERLKNTIEHLKEAITQNRPLSLVEHFAKDLLLTAKKAPAEEQQGGVCAAYQYVCDHFHEKISVTALAKVSGYSVQTLILKFRQQYGKTPIRLMIDLRMNLAKNLLVNTDTPVGQIAEACGYDNVYYFSNVFKKEVGNAPLRFRQNAML